MTLAALLAAATIILWFVACVPYCLRQYRRYRWCCALDTLAFLATCVLWAVETWQ